MVEVVRSVGIQEARFQLQELCGSVAASGESVILSRRGLPIVEVRPLNPPPQRSAPPTPEDPPENLLEALQECRARFGALTEDLSVPHWVPSPE